MNFELTNQVQPTKFQMVISRRHVLNHKPRLAFESCRSVIDLLRAMALWFVLLIIFIFCWQIETEAHKLGERLDFLRVSHEKLPNKIQNMNKSQDFTVEEFEKNEEANK